MASLLLIGKPRRNFRVIMCFRNLCSATCCAPEPSTEERRGLALGIYEGEDGENILTPSAMKFNEHIGGKLEKLLKMALSPIRRGEIRIFNNIDPEFYAVCVGGLGKKNLCYNEMETLDEGTEAVRHAAAMTCQKLRRQGIDRVFIEGMGNPEAAAEGARLALWRYKELRMAEFRYKIPEVELFDDPDVESFRRGLFKADCQNLARRLSDTPANLMTPLHFANEAVNELCPCGIKVEVHDKDWLDERKMMAYLTVARGSCEPPILLEATYCGGPNELKPIVLIGSGNTYDAGGMCLLKHPGTEDNRARMSGAAVVLAAMKAVAGLNLPFNVTGLMPLYENMPSGMAMKCGDVVMCLNGKSVHINNTAKDGRMVLADMFCYAQNVLKPRLIVDIATLTPGVAGVLGSVAVGVFTNTPSLWCQLKKASAITGDRLWPLPLYQHYKTRLTRFISYDVDNRGDSSGIACMGAAFLQEFIHCVDWVHFDTGGCGMICKNKVFPYYTKGRMTGRPTRTIIQFLYQMACPTECT